MKVGLVVLLLILALGGGFIYYTEQRDKAVAHERDFGPCGVVVVREARSRLEAIAARLADADKLAAHTPRVGLAGPLGELQRIARDVRTTEVPQCLAGARLMLASEADLHVESFMAFLEEKDSLLVVSPQVTAKRYHGFYEAEAERVRKCAPGCPAVNVDAAHEAAELERWKEHDRYEMRTSVPIT
jgi:hypothetical protein